MINAHSLFRSLVVYAICLPVAILLGYMLADQTNANMVAVCLLLGALTTPLFLRWHYPWMLFSWNSVIGFYFMKGNPTLCLGMIFVSFGISVLTYIMNRKLKFI